MEDQVLVIDNSIEILKGGPVILKDNQERKDKALLVGNNILTAIAQTGMTPELDERCNKFLVNIKTAVTEMSEKRKGVTQIMDELKKMYTTVEAEMDVKKAGSIPNQIQEHRNKYAKQVAEEQENKRKQLELERQKKEEAINIKAAVNKFISEALISMLAGKKTKMTNAFNNITLVDFEVKSKSLKGMPTAIAIEELKKSVIISGCNIAFKFHSKDEVNVLQTECMENYDWSSFAAKYQTEIQDYKTDLADKLSSKLTELQEEKKREEEAEKAKQEELERQRIAEEKRQQELQAAKDQKAKEELEKKQKEEREAEEKRLKEIQEREETERAAAEKEKQEREEAERQRIINEQEEAKRKAQEEAEIQKQGDLTMNLFNQEAQLAEMDAVPETRQGYEIKVSHPVGFTQLFAFWFEKEGKNLGIDKLEKTSLGQIKAWCEKHAHKTNEQINSQFLKYEATFKAVNRKA